MTPVIPCSTSNITLIPGAVCTVRKSSCLTRCSSSRKQTRYALPTQRFFLPLSTCVTLFPPHRTGCVLHRKSRIPISATGTDVAVEESDSSVEEASSEGSEIQSEGVETSEKSTSKSESSPAATQSKRTRPVRKSEMPPVKNEELILGAMFTGKVRSIQPFGAFVDFGAFTDGLVHVSRLSDSFVKDVASVVSVGQEVKVRLVEVNTESGRISLSMRENDDASKRQQRKDGPAATDRPRPARKNTSKPSQKKEEVKSSKFVKGQDLEGTVKNLTRSGAFISLPEGEEGFLPTSEESDNGLLSMMGGSSLQVGQEVKVRVLRITRGQVTLTMKKEEDDDKFDSQLSQGVVHAATNPFVLAFRQNKEIAAFLDKRDKPEKIEIQPASNEVETTTVSTAADEIVEKETIAVAETVNEDEETTEKEKEETTAVSTAADEMVQKETYAVAETVDKDEETTEKEKEETTAVSTVAYEIVEKETDTVADTVYEDEETTEKEKETTAVYTAADEIVEKETGTDADTVNELETTEKETEEIASVSTAADEIVEKETDTVAEVNKDVETTEKETEESAEVLSPEGSAQAPSLDVVESDETAEPSEQIVDQVLTSTDSVVDENSTAKDEVKLETPQAEDNTPAASVQDEIVGAIPDENGSVSSTSVQPDAPVLNDAKDTVENNASSDPSQESADDQIKSSGSEVIEEKETTVEDSKDQVQIEASALNGEIPSTSQVEVAEAAPQKNNEVTDSYSSTPKENETKDTVENNVSSDPSQESADDQIKSSGSEAFEEAENKVEDCKDGVQIEAPDSKGETRSTSQVEEAEAAPQKNDQVTNSNGSTPKENVTKAATISPALVKQLREETGAGMMDCKKALSETGGDIVKAQEFLRKRGLASAEKRASRITAEGRIGSYIHDGRIGVLVDVNCETDFVSRGDIFKELVDDLAMQVAACPQVQFLVPEDVPEEIVNKEREIEMQKEDLLSKPEQIRSKIVEGRIRKRLEELALLEQPYIKNDKLMVKDWVKQTIATIGENIKVKRFVRLNLGEGLEKKSQDFAAEVAAQTAAKPVPTSGTEQSASVEAKETDQKPKVAVSAALVKQLREETGAGMMDCKKALSETGGDLEKAQDYLRKKGLSTADKKSSRLAAEGRIGSYIHDSRIGVLIEVNCETDFVGRSEKFKELVDDLAMQVVACPHVQSVSVEDIPESIVSKEKELEMQREDLASKPENVREKIVEGRVAKRLGELALLEQPYIKDDKLLVKDLVKQAVAALGENIKVRRFVRFTLGETAEETRTGNEA